jgi:hypothetical protein
MRFSRITIAVLFIALCGIVASQITAAPVAPIGTLNGSADAKIAVLRLKVNELINQPGGAFLAAAHIDGVSAAPAVTRSFTNLPGSPTITVTRVGATGTFEVGFGADVSTRFYGATVGNPVDGTPVSAIVTVTPRVGTPNAVFVDIRNGAGVLTDTNFYIEIH